MLANQTIEALKTLVLDRLNPVTEGGACDAATAASAVVYLICDQLDRASVAPIQDFLFDQSLEVRLPLFDGDSEEIRDGALRDAQGVRGVLMFWGKAKEGWLRTVLRDLNKVFGLGRTGPYKAASLYLAELPDPNKESFRTREVSDHPRRIANSSPASCAPSSPSCREPSRWTRAPAPIRSRAFGPSCRRRRTSSSAATGKATNWCAAWPAGGSSPWWAPPAAASRRSCEPGCCPRSRAASWPAPARTGGWRSCGRRTIPIGFLARAIVDTGALAHLDIAGPAAAGVVETTCGAAAWAWSRSVRLARLEPHENLLILVDQFEELFRFADLAKQRDAGDEAPAFVKLLLEAAQQTDVPVYVVITMRSDFLGDCDRFRGLPEAISDSQYLIPRLTRDELRAVITGPIGVRGGRIAPSLVQRLLNDVGDDMDQLPVLQHALMRAWDHWERHDPESRSDRSGRPRGDRRHGGGAVAARGRGVRVADERPGTHDRRAAVQVPHRAGTGQPGDSPPDAARRASPRSRTRTLAEVIPVIDVFRAPGRSFLMPPHDVALDGDSVIDISHESLIRQWGRLRTWVDEEAESRATYLRLVEAARLRRAGKAGLWGEPDLTYARQWQEREAPERHLGRAIRPRLRRGRRISPRERGGARRGTGAGAPACRRRADGEGT